MAGSGDAGVVAFIAEAKDRIVTILETEYVVPQDGSIAFDSRVLGNPSGTWAVGYCDNTTIVL